MELDDLRRQWRQPEPVVPPALTGPALDALLKGRTGSLVEKMRLAARLEAAFAVLLVLVLAVLVARPPMPNGITRIYSAGALVLTAILLVFYARMLDVLRRMAEPTGSVRGHLGILAQGMRHLLRFYYRLSLAIIPIMSLVISGYTAWLLSVGSKVRHWQPIGRAAAIFLLTAVIGQVVIVYATRWWVQRLYGQHLDRLESQLRELDEPAEH